MGLVEQVVGYDRELGRSPQIAQRLAGQLIQAASRLRAGAALIGVEPPARVSWRVAPAHGRPGARSCCAFSPRRRVRSKPTPAGPREQRTRRRCSRPPWSSEPCLAVARRRDHASWPLADGDDKTDRPADGLRATETPAFADMPGDGAQELSGDLPEEHRSLRRRRSGRALRRRHAARGTRAGADGRRAGSHRHGPERAWQRACPAMRLVGDPHLRNGVRDENAGAEAGSHRRPSARWHPRQRPPLRGRGSSLDVSSGVARVDGPECHAARSGHPRRSATARPGCGPSREVPRAPRSGSPSARFPVRLAPMSGRRPPAASWPRCGRSPRRQRATPPRRCAYRPNAASVRSSAVSPTMPAPGSEIGSGRPVDDSRGCLERRQCESSGIACESG